MTAPLHISGAILHLGDCLDVMRELDADSVDAVVCDPPYGLGFMGKKWDTPGALVEREADRSQKWDHVGGNHNPSNAADKARTALVEGRKFQAWCEVWAREELRVLKPGGHLLAFGGTRTYHRMACAIEDAGFEIRDSLHWLYGTGFPKSLNVGGLGTALKPSHEPCVLARKPLVGTVAENVLAHGTGAMNIDGCRITTADNLNGGAYSGEERKRDNYSASDANAEASLTRLRRGVGEFKQPRGRWPANVILTHSDDCVCMGLPLPSMPYDPATDVVEYVRSAGPELWRCAPGCPVAELDAQSGLLLGAGNKRVTESVRDGSGGAAVGDFVGGSKRRVLGPAMDAGGGASRFFYCAKPSGEERDGNTHPTVKPVSLMRWLTRLVTPPGGIVLDPFMGSGTTGVACASEGFQFIGIEREPAYFAIAERRIRAANAQGSLFPAFAVCRSPPPPPHIQ